MRSFKRKGSDIIELRLIAYLVVGLFAFFALFPFAVLLVNSFSSEHAILNYGYELIPREFSLRAYELIFENPLKMLRTYGLTIFIAAFGTAISLFFSTMAAFVISRKELRYRNILSFFLYFTTLFNGGLVPYYLLISKTFHLQNTIAVMLIVPMFSVINILILRNFISNSIPDSLFESARIDGANDFAMFIRIVLPLSGPALASIGLLTALGYWNDWWTPMMFVPRESMWPLQYTLYNILASINFAANMVNNLPLSSMPSESLKLAMTVVATGPIIFAYPFVQRYFVKGITMGAIKG
jgi:putative aldouronate transport system permease protein